MSPIPAPSKTPDNRSFLKPSWLNTQHQETSIGITTRDTILNQNSAGWLPAGGMSVKHPNEIKPGMKMSTYGGFKRRPKADRYFEDINSSQAFESIGDNSLCAEHK